MASENRLSLLTSSVILDSECFLALFQYSVHTFSPRSPRCTSIYESTSRRPFIFFSFLRLYDQGSMLSIMCLVAHPRFNLL